MENGKFIFLPGTSLEVPRVGSKISKSERHPSCTGYLHYMVKGYRLVYRTVTGYRFVSFVLVHMHHDMHN